MKITNVLTYTYTSFKLYIIFVLTSYKHLLKKRDNSVEYFPKNLQYILDAAYTYHTTPDAIIANASAAQHEYSAPRHHQKHYETLERNS